jgi:ELWxxDGT repeat protein
MVAGAGVVFFQACESASGCELWKSDGTEPGTSLVRDIRPGSQSAKPSQLTVGNNILFFVAQDGKSGRALWRTDGTASGTARLSDFGVGSGELVLRNISPTTWGIIFAANNNVWTSDGTVEGTMLLMDFTSRPKPHAFDWNFTSFASRVYFSMCDTSAFCELWRTDGTPGGTVLVKQIAAGFGVRARRLYEFTTVDDQLFLASCEEFGVCELWKSDGTAEGTVRVAGFDPSDDPDYDDWAAPEMEGLAGAVLFRGCTPTHGCELWKSDGTETGTVQVLDINTNPKSGAFYFPVPAEFTRLNGVLYFFARDAEDSRGLWRTDGTSAGTLSVVRTISEHLTAIGGSLYFIDAADQLWRSDGTAAGTARLTNDPSTRVVSPPYLAGANGAVFFRAFDLLSGTELWAVPACDDGNPCTRDIQLANECRYEGVAECQSTTTTTVTSTPSTLPLCSDGPAGICDDADPCTVDHCGDGGCENVAVERLAKVACILHRWSTEVACSGDVRAPVVGARLQRAERLVQRAAGLRLGKARRLMKRVVRKLDDSDRIVGGVPKLSERCRAAFERLVDDALGAADAWRLSLGRPRLAAR